MANIHPIGKPVPRKEGRKKVTGQALYVDDLSFPEMLHGATVRSPVARVKVTNIVFGGDIGNYRIYASRGTEWSVASQPVTGTANVNLTFTLKRVVPTQNYFATDWHVHQIGSPDSPVLSDDRIRSAVAAGVEMFAVTDHDYVADLQPLVEQLGLTRLLRVVPPVMRNTRPSSRVQPDVSTL